MVALLISCVVFRPPLDLRWIRCVRCHVCVAVCLRQEVQGSPSAAQRDQGVSVGAGTLT
jgi:hypothetical protein